MPRTPRIQYPVALYHIMIQGDQRPDIFPSDVDRHEFIKSLAKACQKADGQVHAFCLLRNHYHRVVETPNANLVSGMAWLQSPSTIRRSHRHRLVRHVLCGRYQAQLSSGNGPVTFGR